ncbi:MAG TPA: OmpH family outer membrane protein [Alphaproteobacteria bacterium]|nr:OmpH family outer membrane protein [Alphaproteobacteria bacterium]
MLRAALFLFAVLTAVPLWAAEPASSPLLIVDVKRILDESKASVGAQKKIEAQRAAFQIEIAAKEKFIREAEQDLLNSRGKIDQHAYADKETSLRQQFREVEQYVQERRRLLEQATTLSMGKVRSVLLGIVTEMARRRNAQAVLIKQQVLWAENALDVTDQVLVRLNAQLPDVPVNIPAPKEPKTGKKS